MEPEDAPEVTPSTPEPGAPSDAPEGATPDAPSVDGVEDGGPAPDQAPAAPVEEGPGAPVGEAPGAVGVEAVEMVPDAPPVADDPGGLSPWLLGGGAALVVALLAGVLLGGGRRAPAGALPNDDALPAPTLPAGTPGEAVPRASGLTGRLADRMARTRAALASQFDRILGREVDESVLEELEEALLIADVGLPTAERVVAPLRERLRAGETDPGVLRALLRETIRGILQGVASHFEVEPPADGPYVVLVVGVNGSGKTTTIGKLAARLVGEGRKVLLVAGDTYRAAAAEQLEVWGTRAGAEVIRQDEGSDPAAVAWEGLDAARARGADVVIVDTAGRLQTRRPLMEQLGKVRRVLDKKVPGAPHQTLLVVDGTMGQNALSQARSFHEATPLDGLVVTKLDGTAKGGMVLAVASEMGLPVKFVGIGEGVDDLRPFDPDAFVDALV